MKKRPADSKSGAGKRVSHGLVALSSVAVLAVYSAGYVRTRAAAARFDVPASGRRGQRATAPAPAPVAPLASAPTASSGPLVTARDSDHAEGPKAKALTEAEAPKALGATKEIENRAAATMAGPSVESKRATAPETGLLSPPLPSKVVAPEAPAVPSAPAATARPADSRAISAPVPVSPLPAAAAPPRPSPPSPETPPPPQRSATPTFAEAPPVDPAEQPFVFRGAFKKDGTFLGWGSSRHGDIQASVQIQNGRIASAVIAQCLTRYSCDVIDKLPPQVVARQSADVDYVSGATESADAFYDAVMDALAKVK